MIACLACGAPMRLIWAGQPAERVWCDACGAIMSVELAIHLCRREPRGERMNYDEMPAGREMDAMVAELMGTPHMKPHHGTCCTCEDCGWPHDECKCGYSADIAAAWPLMQVGWGIERVEDGYNVVESPGHYMVKHLSSADTAPLAICRAALKAVHNAIS